MRFDLTKEPPTKAEIEAELIRLKSNKQKMLLVYGTLILTMGTVGLIASNWQGGVLGVAICLLIAPVIVSFNVNRIEDLTYYLDDNYANLSAEVGLSV